MEEKNKKVKKFGSLMQNAGIWMIFIVLFFVLTIVSENFFTAANLINVVRQIAVTAIAALGVSFVILGGEIDLSQGNLAAFTGCICAMLMAENGISIPLAILAALAIGLVWGTPD